MIDLDRFIVEVDRIITATHLYDELYCKEDAIAVLNNVSSAAFKIIQISLHNDIIMSVSRLLFDGKSYKNNGHEYTYLSQYQLAEKYLDLIDDEIQKDRDQVRTLKETLGIQDFRDLILAHNDKAILIGEMAAPKHNIETYKLLELLKTSRRLIIGIRVQVALKKGEASLQINSGDILLGGVGGSLIKNLKKIAQKESIKTRAN